MNLQVLIDIPKSSINLIIQMSNLYFQQVSKLYIYILKFYF